MERIIHGPPDIGRKNLRQFGAPRTRLLLSSTKLILAGVLIARCGVVFPQEPAPTSPSVTEATLEGDAEPKIVEEDIEGGPSICKSIDKEMDFQVFKDENKALMLQMLSKPIFYSGAPFALRDLDDTGKPTKGWRICIRSPQTASISPQVPDSPYVATPIENLRGLAATCRAEPPGPAICKDALATALEVRGLSAIGSPRVSDIGSSTPQKKYWVPFRIIP